MQKLLNKVFIGSGFEKQDIENMYLDFYFNNKSEFFFIADYSLEEVKDFFDNNKTDKIIDLFEEMKTKEADIKNNTSLIMYVKVNDLEKEIKEIKNQIFRIEEDEYYFKKYILFYTSNSLINLNNTKNLMNYLQDKLRQNDFFDNYQMNNYYNDEFFLIIQLFIKIPFLRFEFKNQEYVSIDNMLQKSLNEKDKKIDQVISEFYQDGNDNKKFERLEKSFLQETEDEVVKDFFKKFGDI